MLVTSSCHEILKPNFIALGNFDGIHQGHRKVLESLFFNDENNHSIPHTVVTFNPHPREFFSGEKKPLLTPLIEKVNLLKNLGIKQLLLLPFNAELASLSPQQFVNDILINKIQPRLISVGEDFCFGQKRAGNVIDLQNLALLKGVKVLVTKEQNLITNSNEEIRISSSYIRHCLKEGNIIMANQMLGYQYQLIGKVIEGQKLGRQIGFPTANLQLPSDKFLPKKGVYQVSVNLENNLQHSFKAVMNIGDRPTIGGLNTTVEVHLLNWAGDLYDQLLTVKLEKFLRCEQKFSSLDELKKQITIDCQNVLFSS